MKLLQKSYRHSPTIFRRTYTKPGRHITTFSSRNDKPQPPPQQSPRVVALERAVEEVLLETGNGESMSRWQEIKGSWVARPSGRPKRIAHFMGGAFIGVAPQLAYKQFLESLADQGILIIATPYSTHFDHLRSADESQFKFDGAYGQLIKDDPTLTNLPIYGVGHSLGSLLLALIGSKFGVNRSGNVLMSFNNKPAQEVIPLMQQVAPAMKLLNPFLSQAESFRPTAEVIREALRGMSPSLVNQITPLAEQFLPIYFDISKGNQEFSPTPEETKKRLKSYYGVRRNLLIKFNRDEIDETELLAAILQSSSAGPSIDLTIRSLPGDHALPMQPGMVDLPPEVTRVANSALSTGGGFIGQLSKMAAQAGQTAGSEQLDRLSKGVSEMASMFTEESRGLRKSRVDRLAEEIAEWMNRELLLKSGK